MEKKKAVPISCEGFLEFWEGIETKCTSDSERLVEICSPGERALLPRDLEALVYGIVDTHPGLAFLGDSPEFRERYVDTVIIRIFYTVNRYV